MFHLVWIIEIILSEHQIISDFITDKVSNNQYTTFKITFYLFEILKRNSY